MKKLPLLTVYAYESISFRDHGILVSEKFK